MTEKSLPDDHAHRALDDWERVRLRNHRGVRKTSGHSIGATSPAPPAAILRYVLFGVAAVIFFLIRAINNHFLAGDLRITGTDTASRYSPDIQRLITAAVITYAFC
jgi:hypothetical protein